MKSSALSSASDAVALVAIARRVLAGKGDPAEFAEQANVVAGSSNRREVIAWLALLTAARFHKKHLGHLAAAVASLTAAEEFDSE